MESAQSVERRYQKTLENGHFVHFVSCLILLEHVQQPEYRVEAISRVTWLTQAVSMHDLHLCG